MVTFLSRRLQLAPDAVGRQLRQHPHWLAVPLLAVSQTVEALLAAGFTPAQLRHGLLLSLYPEQRAVAAARAAAAAGSAVPAEYILQLALYRLERDGHFSGTGVFAFSLDRPAVAAGGGGGEPLDLLTEAVGVPRRGARLESS